MNTRSDLATKTKIEHHLPPATNSRRRPDARLMVLKKEQNTIELSRLDRLPLYLGKDDVIIANDAATIPASFVGMTCDHTKVEIRLLAPMLSENPTLQSQSFFSELWEAFALNHLDWQTPTEERQLPSPLQAGSLIRIGRDLMIRIVAVDLVHSARFVCQLIPAGGQSLSTVIYRYGKPIQYSYHETELDLWDVQTPFASMPVSLEAPSSGFHFTADLKRRIQETAKLSFITHSTGVSDTGSEALNQLLPRPEFYHIPSEVYDKMANASRSGGNVIAIGTGVTRAIESAKSEQQREGRTDLIIDPNHKLRTVGGILTGMHEPGSSHWKLLQAFVTDELLYQAFDLARKEGFLWHEYGDAMLII